MYFCQKKKKKKKKRKKKKKKKKEKSHRLYTNHTRLDSHQVTDETDLRFTVLGFPRCALCNGLLYVQNCYLLSHFGITLRVALKQRFEHKNRITVETRRKWWISVVWGEEQRMTWKFCKGDLKMLLFYLMSLFRRSPRRKKNCATKSNK